MPRWVVAKRLRHERATEAHIEELLPQIRAGDSAEVIAADGNLVRGCYNALHLTDDPIAMRDSEGGLIAVYGAAPMSLMGGAQAAPWLLGTGRMRVNAIGVFHDMKQYLAWLSDHYSRLLNYVDARNVESVAWLARLGFTIGEPELRGPYQMPFHPFYMDFN